LNNRPPPLDPAAPDHHVGGQELHQFAVLVLCAPGDRARLAEAAAVEQSFDPLADVESAARPLALDTLGPAHLAGELLAAAKLLELWLPAHA
jgi:hypothetical protein